MFFTIFWNEKTPFQAIKKRSSKSRKIAFFSKTVNPWFWSKNGHFSNFFFSGNIGQEKVFCDILERKNAFLGYKIKKFKKSKNCHFSKGVNQWFWSKNGHFSNFFFIGKIGQENVFYDILERENFFLGYKKTNFKKPKNCHFSKGVNPWFWSKTGHFSNFFFFGKIGQENVFYDILRRKNSFECYKNREVQKVKKLPFFPKGLTNGFGPKMAIFPSFFFAGNTGHGNVFYDILKRKNLFLGYKIKKFKKLKNCHFSKGVNPWFWSKNGHFSNFFFFCKIGQENVFYYILERKNSFLGYKKKKFKKSKNCVFSKRVNQWFWSKNGHFSNFFFSGNIGQVNVFYDILERNNFFLGYKNKKFKKSKNCLFFQKG